MRSGENVKTLRVPPFSTFLDLRRRRSGQLYCVAKPLVLVGRLTHFLFAGYSKFGGTDYRPGGLRGKLW